MFTVWIVIKNIDNFGFLFFTTSIILFLILFIAVYFNKKSFTENFIRYEIEIEYDSISVRSNLYNQTIEKKSITAITSTQDGEIFIHYKNKHLPISKYLLNIEEFKAQLNSIMDITEKKNKMSYIEHLYLFFFCCVFLVRFVPDYRLYIIATSGFIITASISTIKLIISPIKKTKVMFSIIMNIFLIWLTFMPLIEVLTKIF